MEKDGDEAVWSLTLFRVTKSMAGFYQWEVKILNRGACSLLPPGARCVVPVAPCFGGNNQGQT